MWLRGGIHKTPYDNLTIIVVEGYLIYKKTALQSSDRFCNKAPLQNNDRKKFVRNFVNVYLESAIIAKNKNWLKSLLRLWLFADSAPFKLIKVGKGNVAQLVKHSNTEGQGKSTYTFSAKRQWLSAFRSPPPTCWLYLKCLIGGKVESGTLQKTVTLIYPDPLLLLRYHKQTLVNRTKHLLIF